MVAQTDIFVQLLLASGTDVNLTDVDGNTGRWGTLDLIRVLLDYRADVNAVGDYRQTALMHAAERGQL